MRILEKDVSSTLRRRIRSADRGNGFIACSTVSRTPQNGIAYEVNVIMQRLNRKASLDTIYLC